MPLLQNVEDSSAGIAKSGTDGLGASLNGVGDVSKNVASAPVSAALQGAEKAREGLGMMALYLNMPYDLVSAAVISFIIAFGVAVFTTSSSSAVVRGAALVSVFLGWAAVVRVLFLRKVADSEKKLI